MKIVFFGTPDFSGPFLQALLDDREFEVAAVVCQPDKPVGRGKKLTPPKIKILAEKYQIPVRQPASLKTDEALAALAAYQADFFVVVAYGKIIPEAILQIPKKGAVNVHPSLLPKYRGPSPMQWAIAQGDLKTGISIMLLDQGMDTGPILASEEIGLDTDETYESLVNKIHARGPKLLGETLKRYFRGEIQPRPQASQGASLTRLLKREDGQIDWNQPLAVIERKWRAYQPWPSAWSVWQRKGREWRLKMIELQPADFIDDSPPGTVAIKNNRLFVDCLDGTVEILKIQPEGREPMAIREFLNGHSDIDGAVLH